MKKRLLLITMAMTFALCSCGEYTATEPETKEEQVTENKETETVADTQSTETPVSANEAWKDAYSEIVNEWDKEHKDDQTVGYELAYIDGDDIPELVLLCDDEAWYAVDVYTFNGEAAVHISNDYDERESEYLSPGCQGKGDAYIEKAGIYMMTNGMMGSSFTTGYMLDGDKLTKIFEYSYYDASWDEESTDPYSYSLRYTPLGKEETVIEKSISEDDDYYEVDSIPEAKELEDEFGFSFASKKILGTEQMLTYDKIVEELKSSSAN